MLSSIILFFVMNVTWLLGEWMVYMIITWKYCTILEMFSASVACRIIYAIIFGLTFLGIIGALSGNKILGNKKDEDEKEENNQD